MLPYPDRFRFKSAPPRASRLMFVWFVFLLLVAVLSVGMLLTAIVQSEETHRAPACLFAKHIRDIGGMRGVGIFQGGQILRGEATLNGEGKQIDHFLSVWP
jgi:hypothetical protein